MAMRANKIQPSKTEAIGELKTKIGESNDFIFAEYRGLTVEQISLLRKQLREKGTEFHVVKNNFARIAFEELGFPGEVKPVLVGPVGVAFSKGEANETAKILVDFAKEVPALKVKAGVVDKGFFSAAQVEAFSKLPGKKQLISMFMSALKSPVQKLVYTLVALQEKMGGGGAEAAAPAPEATQAAEAAPAAEPAQA